MTEFYFYFYICFFLCSIIRFTFDFYLNSDILQAVGPHFVVFYCHLRIFIASTLEKLDFQEGMKQILHESQSWSLETTDTILTFEGILYKGPRIALTAYERNTQHVQIIKI